MNAGRVHPIALVLHSYDALKRLLFLVALSIFKALSEDDVSDQLIWLAVIGGSLVWSIAVAALRWWRFRYHLTPSGLEIQSGILRLERRHIPRERVQDLSFEARPLLRLLGLVSVSVQTAGAAGAEAVLAAVTRSEAERLRDALLADAPQGESQANPHEPRPHESQPQRQTDTRLLRVSLVHLIMRGLTDNRAGVLLAGALGVFAESLEVDQTFFHGAMDRGRVALSPLASDHLAVGALVLSVVIAIWMLGYATSAFFNVLLFYGLDVRQSESAQGRTTFHRTYGLLTLRRHALPRARIQALVLAQNLARRVFGLAEMRAIDMGASADARAVQKTGMGVFVPAASLDTLRALVPQLFPACEPEAFDWRRTSPRRIRRTTMSGVLLALPVVALAVWAELPLAPFITGAVALVAFCLMLGLLRHRAIRIAFDGHHLALATGVLGRSWSFVPRSRVEGISLTRTPLDRWHGVASVRVVVGGGQSFRVTNVPFEDARALCTHLVGDSAQTHATARVSME